MSHAEIDTTGVGGITNKEAVKGKCFVFGKGAFIRNPTIDATQNVVRAQENMKYYEFTPEMASEFAKLQAEKNPGQKYHVMKTTEVYVSKVTVEPPVVAPFTFDA